MPTSDPTPSTRASLRPTPPGKAGRTLGMLLLAAAIVGAVWLVNARWGRLPELPGELARYVGFMWEGVAANPFNQPEPAEWWTRAFALMIESLHMAWIGTVIGAALSLPMGFLAARNVSPPAVVGIARAILNGIRAIPELIWAIVIMIPIFGLTPMAGTMALGINSIGTLGKLSSEVIEGIDPGPVEAARATGSGVFQVLRWGTLPQVLPEIVAFWLYRFEINIRAGAILGVVGAGGIGSLMNEVIRQRIWPRAGVMLVVVIGVTIIIDRISARARARIIVGPDVDVREPIQEPPERAGALV